MALFWLSDEAWEAINPHLPKNQPGARRVDDRRVISGILHVLKVGCRWCDCPVDYGPSTTVYNRFNRWSRRGFWLKLLDALVDAGVVTKSTAIDSTYVKAQRAAFGAKGGRSAQAIGRSRGGWTTKVHALTDVVGRPYVLMLTAGNVSDVNAAPALVERAGRMRYLLGDKDYDADRLRRVARDAGAIPVIPGRRNRKRAIHYDKQRYAGRHLIENAFCRLKDFRRVATRYDKLAAKLPVRRGSRHCHCLLVLITALERIVVENSDFAVRRADHVGFSVASLDSALRFWVEGLGGQLVRVGDMGGEFLGEVTGAHGASVRMAIVSLAGQMIELLEYCGVDLQHRASRPFDPGFAHLAFIVDDIDSLLARIAVYEWRPQGKPQVISGGTRAGTKVIYAVGPDGATIELMQLPKATKNHNAD